MVSISTAQIQNKRDSQGDPYRKPDLPVLYCHARRLPIHFIRNDPDTRHTDQEINAASDQKINKRYPADIYLFRTDRVIGRAQIKQKQNAASADSHSQNKQRFNSFEKGDVTFIGNKTADDPIKRDCKEQNDKNKVSIVCQFSFLDEDANTVCKVLMGGDAEHDVWQKILDNNQKGENLEWNIFLAPHHCSWTFFNDNGKEEVLQSAEDILDKQLTGAHIVTSCVKIEDNDNNPPSYKASKEYKKRLKSGNDHFLNTEDEFVATKNPIVFEITKYGKTKKKFVTSSVSEAVNKPAPRAGI